MTDIPLAVSPATRTPGMYLTTDLTAGASSPGTGALRGLIVAPKSTVGTITSDTEIVKAVAGDSAVGSLVGIGSPGHLAAKAAFKENGLALIDVVSPAPSGGSSAAGTLTFASGPPTVDWDITFTIAGREITMVWLAGEADEAACAKAVLAINAKGSDLPVTASQGAGASDHINTLTFKVPGLWGNDCLMSVKQANGASGTVTASGAALTGGSGEPDPATALSNIEGTEYDFILMCTGNADAVAASTSSGPGKLKTHITGFNVGLNAKLQQAIVGVTGALAAAKVGSDQHNFGPMQYVFCNAGQSLPCEWGGAELGARLREEAIDPAANRIGDVYRATLYGAADQNADALTQPETEDALQSGLSPVGYDATGQPMPVRPVTTYYKDSGGNPDSRVLDTSVVSGTYAVAKDLRVAIPREFAKAKLSPDLLPGEEELPEGVVEERDVKSFVNSRVRFWISRGVVVKSKWEEAVAEGTFIVRVNPSDPSQCDLVVPTGIVPPLAKFSLAVLNVGPN